MASAFVSPGDSYRDLLSKGSHEQSRGRVLGFLPEASTQATSRDGPASIHAVSIHAVSMQNLVCLHKEEPSLDEQPPRRQVFLGLKKDESLQVAWSFVGWQGFCFPERSLTHLEWGRMSQGL